MKSKTGFAFILMTGLLHAGTNDSESFVKNYNAIFGDGIAVCSSKKAPSDTASGYHIAEVTKLDGTKEILRVPQNTLGKLKKVGDNYVAEFYSYRWDDKTKTSRTEISYLKLEKNADGVNRLNMYDKNQNFQAAHAIESFSDGSVEFVLGETTAHQHDAGLDVENKDVDFYMYSIKASKQGKIINYALDDLTYNIPSDIKLKIEKETGKKMFTDQLDQNGTRYIGNKFTIEEIKEIESKYGTESSYGGAQPWQTCQLPTDEEILTFNNRNIENAKAKVKKNSRSTLKDLDRGSFTDKTHFKSHKKQEFVNSSKQ